jgi:hypothetical protein
MKVNCIALSCSERNLPLACPHTCGGSCGVFLELIGKTLVKEDELLFKTLRLFPSPTHGGGDQGVGVEVVSRLSIAAKRRGIKPCQH